MSLYVARLDTSGLKHSRVVTPFSAICVADLDRFGAGMGWRAKPCDARRAATARTHLHLQAAAGPASAAPRAPSDAAADAALPTARRRRRAPAWRRKAGRRGHWLPFPLDEEGVDGLREISRGTKRFRCIDLSARDGGGGGEVHPGERHGEEVGQGRQQGRRRRQAPQRQGGQQQPGAGRRRCVYASCLRCARRKAGS